MEDLIGIIAILIAVGLPVVSAFVIVLTSIRAKHQERMGLISQGVIPPDTVKMKANPNRYVSLRNGIVLISLGIGMFVGYMVAMKYTTEDSQVFYIMLSSIVLFLGFGYLVYFLITRKMYLSHEEQDVAQD